ncbi:hypothetical protein Ade02nite_24590 [Paractinoplanes deccanensis]|uniref:Periplasmic copper-binding protein NosD beta helix domain-containing protein n=1 Tax=Paractinoplanes deccanensis TaxID=113561 RepID=A0ABQ3Y1I1_9ACTN|nr:hypothetical protein Ade02nite_24590 [Actinoplanes deccanensis]
MRDCPQCVLGQHGLVAPEELLLGMVALPVPAAVAAGIAGVKAASMLPKMLAVAAARHNLCFVFGSGEGNRVRGNRFSGNGRSGLDLNFASPVTVEYNWSYDDGENVLAGAGHALRHNAAWASANHGFTDDAGAISGLTLTNNTAFANRGSGLALPGGPATLRANAAISNGIEPAGVAPGSTETRNSWQENGWSAATFRSTDPASAEGPRAADGTFPETHYLVTGNGVGASMRN